jgi:hypothetical protein
MVRLSGDIETIARVSYTELALKAEVRAGKLALKARTEARRIDCIFPICGG